MTPEDQKNYDRYMAAMHAVQSAIALEIQVCGDKSAGADPKHLRTGVNSCLVDSSTVAQLLMAKGVFTESEYFAALANAAEREQAAMTERLRKKTGNPKLRFG